MVILLAATVGLVAWALHLMQSALTQREFSLMLAGFLVVSAAAALLLVYFLVNNSMGYMAQAMALEEMAYPRSIAEFAADF